MEWRHRYPEKKKAHSKKYYDEVAVNRKDAIKADKAIRVQAKQQYVLQYLLNHPCACGEGDPVCLQFHHRDPSTKDYSVSNMITSTHGIETLKLEIEKCEVLCANCHLKHHAAEKGFYKFTKKSDI